MTMYNREFNAPLSRYNSKKRELQTSMLEYSERVRTINAAHDDSILTDNNQGLEIRARRHHISRYSDPTGHVISQNNHRHGQQGIRRRPHSLDDKELLRNKQLNQSLVRASRRRVRSEYGQPIVIPTESSSVSNVSNPPNSPDVDRSGNVRVNFVSTSDLYDLVDFGQGSKSSPRHGGKARLSSVEDGMKLIEQIDLRTKCERRTAWGSNNRPKDENRENIHSSFSSSSSYSKTATRNDIHASENSANNVLGGFITGKSIKSRRKMNNDSSVSSDNNGKTVLIPISHNNNNNSNKMSPRKQTGLNKTLPVITSANKNEIYPLNVFLETVLSSCKGTKTGKLRHRPKRAKRMQLHKSELVVIPEDGADGGSSENREKSSRNQKVPQDYNTIPIHGTPHVPSNSSLAAIKEGITRSRKQQGTAHLFSEKDDYYINSENNVYYYNKNNVSVPDGNGKILHSQKKKTQSAQTLDVVYRELPRNDGNVEGVEFDPDSDISNKHKKMKKLVFLKDQPENTYRR